MNPVLARLLAQRQEQIDFITHLMEAVEKDNRDLVDAERANVQAAKDRIGQLDAQIQPLQEFEAVRAAHQQTASQVTPTVRSQERQPLGAQERQHVYRTAGEFIVDYLKARGMRLNQEPGAPDVDARQRSSRCTA